MKDRFSPSFPWRGLGAHLVSTLRLNFRSRSPLIYGYLVPVFFLLAFGAVFRGGSPPLLREMGQLLTITILGGACFGLPTALVAERDRGVWRRYRLLPASTTALILSAATARVVLVASAAALQWGLAWCLYRTPPPACPAQCVVAFGGVCFAFVGMGLVIAALAENVPAVQAIGQCVFLPMILIGGVGVPLRLLPTWAQRLADFLPGRYAVEALNACILPDGGGWSHAVFAFAALGMFGTAGFAAGFALFRWDAGPRRLTLTGKGWIALPLTVWLCVGAMASGGHGQARTKVVTPPTEDSALSAGPWEQLTETDLATIRSDDLPPDEGYLSPVAASFAGLDGEARQRIASMRDQLAVWPPALMGAPDQRVRSLLCVCAVADLAEDENEGEIAATVFNRLRQTFPAPELKRLLGWIVLHPTEGTTNVDVSGFGIEPAPDPAAVRERCGIYARKLLLRLRRDVPASANPLSRTPAWPPAGSPAYAPSRRATARRTT